MIASPVHRPYGPDVFGGGAIETPWQIGVPRAQAVTQREHLQGGHRHALPVQRIEVAQRVTERRQTVHRRTRPLGGENQNVVFADDVFGFDDMVFRVTSREDRCSIAGEVFLSAREVERLPDWVRAGDV